MQIRIGLEQDMGCGWGLWYRGVNLLMFGLNSLFTVFYNIFPLSLFSKLVFCRGFHAYGYVFVLYFC